MNIPSREGFIKYANANGHYLVGAKGEPHPDSNYEGPVAEVYVDGDWLMIVTDEHEGAVMLNIEALPYLHMALSMLIRDQKALKI